MDPKKDEFIENHTKFKVLETTKMLKTGIIRTTTLIEAIIGLMSDF